MIDFFSVISNFYGHSSWVFIVKLNSNFSETFKQYRLIQHHYNRYICVISFYLNCNKLLQSPVVINTKSAPPIPFYLPAYISMSLSLWAWDLIDSKIHGVSGSSSPLFEIFGLASAQTMQGCLFAHCLSVCPTNCLSYCLFVLLSVCMSHCLCVLLTPDTGRIRKKTFWLALAIHLFNK